ncbi:hypothetical protein [Methylohalobius crimeensis]|uniref:hypothetical protein n=1 Tax=Methylohalobius crimeensis TaxID=244365 RepID=UPI0003B6C466|nr:hypothetical protein [Methylohalobius crimeensis]
MRYHTLLQIGLIFLAMVSIQARAANDPRYPASDFEPEVVYQDEGMVAVAASDNPMIADEAPASDPDYPAAYFHPEVVFQDPDLIETTGPSTAAMLQSTSERSEKMTPTRVSRAAESTGTISDATPPYGVMGVAIAVIGVAFWWSSRQKKNLGIAPEAEIKATSEAAAMEAELEEATEASEEAEEALDELAAEAEETLATSNRQRAHKTKRSRRR